MPRAAHVPLIDALIRPFLTARFLKFGTVGASGVVVNLAALSALLAAHVHANVASALAIELSLVSNFLVNYAWTFRDRRDHGSIWRQGLRFHLVCLVGAGIQWLVFVVMNVVWLHAALPAEAAAAYHAGHGEHAGWLAAWIARPLLDPPEVGRWVYASQLLGIGCGMFWNYLLNYYWTWGANRAAHTAGGGSDHATGEVSVEAGGAASAEPERAHV